MNTESQNFEDIVKKENINQSINLSSKSKDEKNENNNEDIDDEEIERILNED